MKRTTILSLLIPLVAVLYFVAPSCDKVNEALKEIGLSNEEIVQGLRTALDTAARDASGKASVVGGFLSNELIRIGLPSELEPVASLANARTGNAILDNLLGQQIGSLTTQFVESMNHAAEFASREALPIFSKAITDMTVVDGLAILQGGDSAATHYMRTKTSDSLRSTFKPVIENAMAQAQVMSYWTPLSKRYNQIVSFPGAMSLLESSGITGLPSRLPDDFSDYITDKGLDGLYRLMTIEEKKIRDNPTQYASSIIQKVFNSPEALVGKVTK